MELLVEITTLNVHYEVRDWNAGSTLDEQRMAPSEENLDYLVDTFYDSIY
ncbi:MAG: hypothetical protein ACI9CD_000110 [Candidatus Deianiraeaceae bacterium]|jgi:hypothetical protein